MADSWEVALNSHLKLDRSVDSLHLSSAWKARTFDCVAQLFRNEKGKGVVFWCFGRTTDTEGLAV